MEGGQKNRTSLSTNLADMAKIKGALIGDISRQTGSVLQGGLTDDANCTNLANRIMDYYDKDSSQKLEAYECGNMITDVYKHIGRLYESTDEDKNEMVKLLDKDNKGYITISDIEKMLKKYLV